MSRQDSDSHDEIDEHPGGEHLQSEEDIEDHGFSDLESTSSESDSGPERIWWPDHIGLDVEILRKEALDSNSSTGSGTQSGRLNPSLCAFCRVFFDTWEEVTTLFYASSGLSYLETSHFENREALVESSQRGCHLCRYFAHLVYLETTPNLQSKFALRGIMVLEETSRYGWAHNQEQSHEDHWRLSLWVVTNGSEDLGLVRKYGLFLVPSDIEEESGNKFDETLLQSEQTGLLRPDKSLHIAHGWLEECRKSHDCHDPKQSPTRLIKINDNKIRLCITHNEEDFSIYASLSHCWGKSQIIRLLQHNIDEFMNEIPYDALSKTFRDAIEIARELCFDCIWIDSLCIVQDDPEDWAREASLMAGVYGSSSMNIAATASPDGSKGCLFDRDAVYVQGGKLDVNNARKAYRFCDEYLFSRNLENRQTAPLLDRAWVLQERLLAPRSLHFAASQLFWECNAKFACEAFPNHVPHIFKHKDSDLTTKEIWKDWEFIVIRYCATAMTNSSDKLVALAGMARRISDLTGDSYHAGLWKSNFERGLCWFVDESDIALTLPTKPSAGMVFPSWSWSSISGGVQPQSYFPTKLRIRHIEIVDIDIVLSGPDPFGNITKATLTIKSTFLVCATKMPAAHMKIRGRFYPEGEILWDCLEYEENKFMLLSLGIFGADATDIYGSLETLVLVPTHHCKGEYRRIGKYRVFQRETSVLLEDVRSKILDDPFELRDSSHLPTEEDCISISMDGSGVKWYEINIV